MEKEKLALPSGKIVLIDKEQVVFKRWLGKPLEDDYGGKQVLDFKGCPSLPSSWF